MYPQVISKSVTIAAAPEQIWPHLVDASLLQQWMAGDSMTVEFEGQWKPLSALLVRGQSNGHPFTNVGKILELEPSKKLVYTSLSSLSNLADSAENYTQLSFVLYAGQSATELQFKAEGFVSFEIFAHHNFYWPVALLQLKKQIETNYPLQF